MGTNYYVIPRVEAEEKKPRLIHIGKSSAGWQFLFNHNGWKYFKTKAEFLTFLETNQIISEYKEEIDYPQFMDLVKAKEGGMTGEKYAEQWDEIHPDLPKPSYMVNKEPTDFVRWGYRFSTSTEFF